MGDVEFDPRSFELAFDDYQVLKQVGKGGYGLVYSVKKRSTGQIFAAKRLVSVFAMPVVGRRVLREIKVLRHLRGHENIVFLHEVLRPSDPMFQEIYIVQEFMPSDLSKIIHSKQQLTEEHFQYFLYQILRGLKFVHSAGIMHRDLKPSNLLVNESCDLKICDFGLARGVSEDEFHQNTPFMTEYVATRWYRAPEIMVALDAYTKAVDIWSVGCIFGEMLWRRPIFRGNDYVHQLKLILAMRGTPPPQYFSRIVSESTREYLRALPQVSKAPLHSLFSNVSEQALDLLDRMLAWIPEERITAVEALAHPFLARYHNPGEEPTCPPFDPRFENDAVNEVALRTLLTKEVDFDRIRWAQLAEQRTLLENLDESRQLELRLAETAQQAQQLAEEALERTQQQTNNERKRTKSVEQQDLPYQQPHEQVTHVEAPPAHGAVETVVVLDSASMDFSYGIGTSDMFSPPRQSSASISASWRNLVSPNARLSFDNGLDNMIGGTETAAPVGYTVPDQVGNAAWLTSPKPDTFLSQAAPVDMQSGGVDASAMAYFTWPGADMDGGADTVVPLSAMDDAFFRSLEGELSGFNRGF